MAEKVIRDDSDRGSPQYAAWLLLSAIAHNESKLSAGLVKADKKWIIETYEQCLKVTTGHGAKGILKEE